MAGKVDSFQNRLMLLAAREKDETEKLRWVLKASRDKGIGNSTSGGENYKNLANLLKQADHRGNSINILVKKSSTAQKATRDILENLLETFQEDYLVYLNQILLNIHNYCKPYAATGTPSTELVSRFESALALLNSSFQFFKRNWGVNDELPAEQRRLASNFENLFIEVSAKVQQRQRQAA